MEPGVTTKIFYRIEYRDHGKAMVPSPTSWFLWDEYSAEDKPMSRYSELNNAPWPGVKREFRLLEITRTDTVKQIL